MALLVAFLTNSPHGLLVKVDSYDHVHWFSKMVPPDAIEITITLKQEWVCFSMLNTETHNYFSSSCGAFSCLHQLQLLEVPKTSNHSNCMTSSAQAHFNVISRERKESQSHWPLVCCSCLLQPLAAFIGPSFSWPTFLQRICWVLSLQHQGLTGYQPLVQPAHSHNKISQTVCTTRFRLSRWSSFPADKKGFAK